MAKQKQVEEVKKALSFDFADDFEDVAAPEESTLVTGDVVGYWDIEKNAIRCILLSVKMFDGQLDSRKVSCLVIAELTVASTLHVKNADSEEWEYVKAPVGSKVGIWYKPGMRAIVNKCGVDCYIKLVGERKVNNKANPMKTFEVRAGQGGTRIPITEDSRQDSADALTDFHDKSPKNQKTKKAPVESDDDDVDDLFE